MADAPSTAAAAPAEGAPAPAGTEKPAEKPAIDPSEAGRTLNQRRQAHMQALRERGKAAAEAKTAPAAAEKPATATPEAKKEGDEGDDDLAALMKEDRRLKTEAKTIESRAAAVKDVEEIAPVVRQAREHWTAGNRLDAFDAVFGKAARKELLWDLLKDNPEGAEDAAPDVKTLVRTELEERDRAAATQREKDATAAQQKEAQRLSDVDRTVGQPGFAGAVAEIPSLKGIDPGTVEAFGKYVGAVGAYFADHKAEFRAVDRQGVSPLQVVQKTEAMRLERLKADPRATPPTPAEVLKALDDELLAAARELAGVQAPAPGRPAPIPTFSSAFQQSPGTPAPAEDRHLTVEERREAHRKALRERRTA